MLPICPICSGKFEVEFGCDCKDYPKHSNESSITQQIVDQAAKYRWLKQQLEFNLGGYNGPDVIQNASWSVWSMRSKCIFSGTNKPPADVDKAIEQAIAKADPKINYS